MRSQCRSPDEFRQIFFVDSLIGLAPQLAALHKPWLGPYVGADHHLLFPGALHLKSAVTQIRDDAVLINPQWVEGFDDYQRIAVHPDEPFAANALRIGDSLIYSMSFPRTLEKLAGLDVRLVDASEIAKAEGGVTCCSIVLSV